MSFPAFGGPRCRVITDNDYCGDPDGLVQLVHQILSPSAVSGLGASGAGPSKARKAVAANSMTYPPAGFDGSLTAKIVCDRI